MKISTTLSRFARRFAKPAMVSTALTIACIAAISPPQALASTTTAELFSTNARSDMHGTVSGNGHSEARIAVGHGFVEFIRHPDGSVGVGAAGLAALKAVDNHIRRSNATPLELFHALAPAGAMAPASLVDDHKMRARIDRSIHAHPRTLSSVRKALPFVVGRAKAAGPIQPDPLCANNDYSLWEFMFADPNENPSIDWAGHDWGHGTWTGDANITLGSSSAGTLMICPPTDVRPGESPTASDIFDWSIRLAVHEYVAQEGWHQIWFINTVTTGNVYGYSYKGYVVRKLRMTVRQFPHFYWWAAAY